MDSQQEAHVQPHRMHTDLLQHSYNKFIQQGFRHTAARNCKLRYALDMSEAQLGLPMNLKSPEGTRVRLLTHANPMDQSSSQAAHIEFSGNRQQQHTNVNHAFKNQ
jgi:hypothetical protein